MKTRNYALKLVALNVAAFLLELAFPGMMRTLGLTLYNAVTAPWTIITSMFIHADFEHLLYNMFALGFFGFMLERIVGSKKFIALYLVAGVAAAFASLVSYPDSLSIGASGATMGIIGCLAVLRPRMMVYWGGAPLPMVFMAFLWISLDVVGIFVPADQIGHAAHLAGFACGVISAFLWREEFSEKKEVEDKVRKEMSDDELDEWEKKYMK